MLYVHIHQVPTMYRALGWGLEDVDPKREQESWLAQTGNLASNAEAWGSPLRFGHRDSPGALPVPEAPCYCVSPLT